LFTGELSCEHGTTSQDILFTSNSLAERMKDKDYSTLGITNNALISPELNFDKGFEKFLFGEDIPIKGRGLDTLGQMLESERSGEFSSRTEKYSKFFWESIRRADFSSLMTGARYLRSKISDQNVELNPDSGALYTNKLVKSYLKENKNSFVFLNYMEPHEPYNPPQEYGEKFVDDYQRIQKAYLGDVHGTKSFDRDLESEMVEGITGLYDAEIKYLDSRLEELWEILEEELDDFVLVIVGDHGENLGHYNGMWGHQFGIWERLVRVPIIVAGPDISDIDLEDNISIRELHDFIIGEKDLEDLGSKCVFAEYYGADGFFKNFTEENPLELEKEYGNIVFNRSKMIVEDDLGLISHTNAANFPFVAEGESFSEKVNSHEKESNLSNRLEDKFNSVLEDVDL
jgi:hypothetical protein